MVKIFGDKAFFSNYALTELYLPKVTTIGTLPFQNDSALKTVTVSKDCFEGIEGVIAEEDLPEWVYTKTDKTAKVDVLVDGAYKITYKVDDKEFYAFQTGESLTSAQVYNPTAPEGQKFDGWYDGEDKVAVAEGYKLTGNVTVTAKFTEAVADKTELDEAIKEAKDVLDSLKTGVTMVTDGQEALQKAYNQAKELQKDANATQDDVNQIVKVLTEATEYAKSKEPTIEILKGEVVDQCHLVKKTGNHKLVVAFLFCDKKVKIRLYNKKVGILNIIRRNYRRTKFYVYNFFIFKKLFP